MLGLFQWAAVPVLLVRHADAGSRHKWSGKDERRPLSKRGQRQASGLVEVLEGYDVSRVLSSLYVRCVQSVAPLAAARGLTVEDHPALVEGHGRQALKLVRSVAGSTVVLCSHGDVIPDVLAALEKADGLDLGPEPHCAKGSTWVLEGGEGKPFSSALYLPPWADA